MKRKDEPTLFDSILQTIVTPLIAAGGCLGFVLFGIPFTLLVGLCWLGIVAGALTTVFWPIIYGLNLLQGNEMPDFWTTEIQGFLTLVFFGALHATIVYLQQRFEDFILK
ncbi:hypothetical protein ACTGWK_03565 [Streptococcus suis]